MPRPPKLTSDQKNKLSSYEKELRRSVKNRDLKKAKKYTVEIQRLLRKTGHETRLMQSKNWYFECELEVGNYNTAISGFEGVRNKVNKRTRVYLEATALLAICYLRKKDIDKAEPLIHDALNSKAIVGRERRKEFINLLTDRFEEEGALATLIDYDYQPLNKDEIHDAVGELVRTRSEYDLEKSIGRAIPDETIDFIIKIHELSKKQLPAHEIKFLPPQYLREEKEKLGKKILNAFNRSLWSSLCDSENSVRKTLVDKTLALPLTPIYVTSTVVASMTSLRIGIYPLAVAITAYIIRLGIDTFCEVTEPHSILSKRNRPN